MKQTSVIRVWGGLYTALVMMTQEKHTRKIPYVKVN